MIFTCLLILSLPSVWSVLVESPHIANPIAGSPPPPTTCVIVNDDNLLCAFRPESGTAYSLRRAEAFTTASPAPVFGAPLPGHSDSFSRHVAAVRSPPGGALFGTNLAVLEAIDATNTSEVGRAEHLPPPSGSVIRVEIVSLGTRPAPNSALLSLRVRPTDIEGVSGVVGVHPWPASTGGVAGPSLNDLPSSSAPLVAWHMPRSFDPLENGPGCVAGGSSFAFASRGGTVMGYGYGTAAASTGPPTDPEVSIANWVAVGTADRALTSCAASATGGDVVFLAATATLSGVWVHGGTGALLGNVANDQVTRARAVVMHPSTAGRMYMLAGIASAASATGDPTHIVYATLSGTILGYDLVPGGTVSASPSWLAYSASREALAMPLSKTHTTHPAGIARAYTVCSAGKYRRPSSALVSERVCTGCPRNHYRTQGQILGPTDPPLPCDPCEVGKYTTGTGNTNSAACVACPASPAADSTVEPLAWTLLDREAGTTLKGGSINLGTLPEDTVMPFNLTLDVSSLTSTKSPWIELSAHCTGGSLELTSGGLPTALTARLRVSEGSLTSFDTGTSRLVIHGAPADIASLLGPADGSARIVPTAEHVGSVNCHVVVRNALMCPKAASVTAAGGTSGAALDADAKDGWIADAIVAAHGDASQRAAGGSAMTQGMIARAVDAAIDVARVHFVTTAVNDPPVVKSNGGASVHTSEDVPVAVPFTITDPDVPSGHAVLVTVLASVGKVGFPASTESSILGFTDGGNGQGRMTFLATLPIANQALGQLVLTPKQDYHGSETITVTVSDRHDMEPGNIGAAAGTYPALQGTVTITVFTSRTDDLPSIVIPSPLTTAEDTAFLVSPPITVSDGDAPYGNDIIIIATVGHGRLSLLPSITGDTQTLVAPDNVDNSPRLTLRTKGRHLSLSYTPNADWHGDDELSVTVQDLVGGSGAAKRVITVTPVNDAPRVVVAAGGALDAYAKDGLVLPYGQSFRLFVGGSGAPLVTVADADGDGDNLVATLTTTSGGSFELAAESAATGRRGREGEKPQAQARHQTVVVPLAALASSSASSSAASSLRLEGTAASVSARLARVVYRPPTTSTTDTVQLSLADASGAVAASFAVKVSTCAAGTYASPRASAASQAIPTTYECLPCAVGTHSPAPGMSSCTPCPAGTHAGTVGSSSCAPCPPGSRSAESEGSAKCLSCDRGWISALGGTAACQPCPMGTFAGLMGSTSCTACPAGSFTNGTGSATCTPCVPGTTWNGAVDTGNITNATTTTTTTTTTTGTGTGTGTGVNTTTSDANANNVCQACPAGTREEVDPAGFKRCTPCLPGQVSIAGSTRCDPCPQGTYGVPGTTTAAGIGNATGAFPATATNPPSCLQCPANTVTTIAGATGISDCLCAVGFYGNHGGPCKRCPTGGRCQSTDGTHGSVTPVAAEGHYLSSSSVAGSTSDLAEFYQFHECVPSGACGEAGACADGYAGKRCGRCAVGRYRMLGRCLRCPDVDFVNSKGGTATLAVLLSAAVSIAALVMGPLGSARALVMISVFQLLHTAGRTDPEGWSDEAHLALRVSSIVGLNIEVAMLDCGGWVASSSSPSSSSFPSSQGINATEPGTTSPALVRVVAQGLLPIAATCVLGLALLVVALHRFTIDTLSTRSSRFRSWTARVCSGRGARARLMRGLLLGSRSLMRGRAVFAFGVRCLGAAVAVWVACAPAAVDAALTVARCVTQIDGTRTWLADPSEDCGSSPWSTVLIPSALFFALHAVVVPVVLVMSLRRVRHHLDDPTVLGVLGPVVLCHGTWSRSTVTAGRYLDDRHNNDGSDKLHLGAGIPALAGGNAGDGYWPGHVPLDGEYNINNNTPGDTYNWHAGDDYDPQANGAFDNAATTATTVTTARGGTGGRWVHRPHGIALAARTPGGVGLSIGTPVELFAKTLVAVIAVAGGPVAATLALVFCGALLAGVGARGGWSSDTPCAMISHVAVTVPAVVLITSAYGWAGPAAIGFAAVAVIACAVLWTVEYARELRRRWHKRGRGDQVATLDEYDLLHVEGERAGHLAGLDTAEMFTIPGGGGGGGDDVSNNGDAGYPRHRLDLAGVETSHHHNHGDGESDTPLSGRVHDSFHATSATTPRNIDRDGTGATTADAALALATNANANANATTGGVAMTMTPRETFGSSPAVHRWEDPYTYEHVMFDPVPLIRTVIAEEYREGAYRRARAMNDKERRALFSMLADIKLQ